MTPFDPYHKIAVGTAWLYSQFGHGTLTGYEDNPAAGRAESAFDLQHAIWTLEGADRYGTLADDIADNLFLNDVANAFGGGTSGLMAAMVQGGVNSDYDVGVAQLTDANGRHVAMLILIPDGGSTLMLLGMGLSGLAILGRKAQA